MGSIMLSAGFPKNSAMHTMVTHTFWITFILVCTWAALTWPFKMYFLHKLNQRSTSLCTTCNSQKVKNRPEPITCKNSQLQVKGDPTNNDLL